MPSAIGDFLVLRALRESQGAAVAVEDQAMLEGVRDIARTEGVVTAPEGGATLAALKQLLADGTLSGSETVLLFLTAAATSTTRLCRPLRAGVQLADGMPLAAGVLSRFPEQSRSLKTLGWRRMVREWARAPQALSLTSIRVWGDSGGPAVAPFRDEGPCVLRVSNRFDEQALLAASIIFTLKCGFRTGK